MDPAHIFGRQVAGSPHAISTEKDPACLGKHIRGRQYFLRRLPDDENAVVDKAYDLGVCFIFTMMLLHGCGYTSGQWQAGVPQILDKDKRTTDKIWYPKPTWADAPKGVPSSTTPST